PEWNVIKKIKESLQTDPALKGLSKDFLEQTTVTAIELLENALKYTDSDSGRPVEFSFDSQAGYCAFRVKNYSKNAQNKDALRSVIDRIRDGDPFELYVARLEQLKEDPDGHSRMGLYRIAYEGEYHLSADIDGESVTILARRPLENA
ncbi:MAG TPA: hypothetical protein PLB73_16770, partial [Leptospiraceae bacterium]|nr:hypothetical protein [Leptospiraceae bacterium]